MWQLKSFVNSNEQVILALHLGKLLGPFTPSTQPRDTTSSRVNIPGADTPYRYTAFERKRVSINWLGNVLHTFRCPVCSNKAYQNTWSFCAWRSLLSFFLVQLTFSVGFFWPFGFSFAKTRLQQEFSWEENMWPEMGFT